MSYYLYVGTYTGGFQSDHKDTASKGIYCFRMEPVSGELSDIRSYGINEIDPGFIAVRGRYLFAENERRDMGTVRSFHIGDDGSLAFIDKIESDGSKCAFICQDRFGPYVFATNYESGSVMVLRCAEDGKLTLTDQVQHHGKSIVPVRQDAPRAHSAKQTPNGDGIIVPDLGIDKVLNYKLDRKTGKLSPNPNQPFIQVDAGEGPRHLVFHPNGRFVYVGTEIGNHVYAYSFCVETGILTQIQKVSLLPDNFSDASYSAEIIITVAGDYVYVSNRGHDTITCYKTDQETGLLEPVGWYPTGGRGPRHLCLAPDESYMICANKDDDTITIIMRDKETGALGEIRYAYEVPAPSCVVWTEV